MGQLLASFRLPPFITEKGTTQQLEEVNTAFHLYRETRTLTALDDRQLQLLPTEFLCNWAAEDVPLVYHRLPEDIQKLPCIRELRPCLQHYNTGRTHIDGPPPAKRDCLLCQRGRKQR